MSTSTCKMLVTASRLLLLTICLIKPAVSLPQTGTHYNVLFIVMDDMNERAGVFGYPEVLTPNLNRLAQRGVVFKKAYCQFPLCNASRTSLLSGWRPDKTGVFDNNTSPRSKMGQNVKFLPEYFGLYGYHTERVGKIMHGGYQNEIDWDYSDRTRVDDLSSGAEDGSWWVTSLQDDKTVNGKYAGAMVQRMKQTPPQPFFLALGLTVHNPFTPSLKYWNMYGVPSVQQLLPVNESGDKGTLKGNGSGNIDLPDTPPNDRNDAPNMAFPSKVNKTTAEWQNTQHAYFAEVTEMDAQLGTVLDEMDRQNLWQNTVVIFLSDHGQHLGEHEGLWGKNTLFEESGLSPLIVYVPGKTPGTCNALAELVDIYPSLAEICSLPAPSGMEGTSFARLLNNVNTPWKEAVFTQVERKKTKGRSAITNQYRYNSWGPFGEELYDLTTDSFEYTNLSGKSAYTSELKMMRDILADGWTKALPPSDLNANKTVAVNNEAINAAKNNTAADIIIYPNPSPGGNISVQFKSNNTANAEIIIYDNAGRIVFKMINKVYKGNNVLPLQLKNITAGIYNLELNDNGIKQQAKLILEK